MKLKTLFASIAILACGLACAADDQNIAVIKKNITKVLGPNGPVESVKKTSMGDLYELVTPRGIFYTDKTGSFLIHNAVILDSATQTDLTKTRMDEISRFKWSDLPLKDAIKFVNGNGKRVIATIEDPNCGFCKKLAPELAKLPNTTIYTFVVAILGPESTKISRDILCSDNPQTAWLNYMRDSKAPEASKLCETPLERNSMLNTKLRVMGTPAILFTSGNRIPGYSTAEKIEEELAKIK